jgi:hypothetical protein
MIISMKSLLTTVGVPAASFSIMGLLILQASRQGAGQTVNPAKAMRQNTKSAISMTQPAQATSITLSLFVENQVVKYGSGPSFVVRIFNRGQTIEEVNNLCDTDFVSGGITTRPYVSGGDFVANLHVRLEVSGPWSQPLYLSNGLVPYTGRIFKKPVLPGSTAYLDAFFQGIPEIRSGKYKVVAVVFKGDQEVARSAETEILVEK